MKEIEDQVKAIAATVASQGHGRRVFQFQTMHLLRILSCHGRVKTGLTKTEWAKIFTEAKADVEAGRIARTIDPREV